MPSEVCTGYPPIKDNSAKKFITEKYTGSFGEIEREVIESEFVRQVNDLIGNRNLPDWWNLIGYTTYESELKAYMDEKKNNEFATFEIWKNHKSFIGEYMYKHIFNELVGFALPNKIWVTELTNQLKFYLKKGNVNILSLASGSGCLEWAIETCCPTFNVICTDDYSWTHFHELCEYFHHINIMDVEKAINKYIYDVDAVLISWPPYNDEMAFKALSLILEKRPELLLIYIGEDWGGCCADDNFFDLIDEKEGKDLTEDYTDINKYYQTFAGIYDRVFIYDFKYERGKYYFFEEGVKG